MSEKKINLEEILKYQKLAISKDYLCGAINMGKPYGNDYKKILDAMKEAIRQSLELAAENAKAYYFTDKHSNGEPSYAMEAIVDKNSILDTINQIE